MSRPRFEAWQSYAVDCPHCQNSTYVLFDPEKGGEVWTACGRCGEVLHVVLEDGKVEVD